MKRIRKKQYGIPLFCLLALMMVMLSGCGGQNKEEQTEEKIITCVKDLEGARIGVQLGTTGDKYASSYEGDDAGTKITRFNKGSDAIQALKQKKVDCVIIDEQPAMAYVSKNQELSILEE